MPQSNVTACRWKYPLLSALSLACRGGWAHHCQSLWTKILVETPQFQWIHLPGMERLACIDSSPVRATSDGIMHRPKNESDLHITCHVDTVYHSMRLLSCAYWLNFIGGRPCVDDPVILGEASLPRRTNMWNTFIYCNIQCTLFKTLVIILNNRVKEVYLWPSW